MQQASLQIQQDPKRQLLTCQICHKIYYKPVTLACGHTFCKYCIRKQINPEVQKNNQQAQTNKNLCIQCQSIIWKGVPQMKQNIVIKSLVNSLFRQQFQQRQQQFTDIHEDPQIMVSNDKLYNKILINVKEPDVFPLPYAFSQIQFETAFIEDINEQAKCIVITCSSLQEGQRKIGLVGALRKIQCIDRAHGNAPIVTNEAQANHVLQKKYLGIFQGSYYVYLDSIQIISVNVRRKIIILGDELPQTVLKNLQICTCSIVQCKNTQNLQSQDFILFFNHYQHLNNPHFLHQIRNLISQDPFLTRNQYQKMLYCILRILKIPNQMRKKLSLEFDNQKRITQINSWLSNKTQKNVQDVINIRVPGKMNHWLVFLFIFLAFMYNVMKAK